MNKKYANLYVVCIMHLLGLRKYGNISVTISAYTSVGTSDNATSSPVVVRTFEDCELPSLDNVLTDHVIYTHSSWTS